MRNHPARFLLALIAAIALTGCSGETELTHVSFGDPDPSAPVQPMVNRVLAEMPGGEIVTPTQVKVLAGETASVVIAGRIDAGSVDPFQPGEMTFMISQLPDEGHAADDPEHADNCPFCKRELANAPKAIVQFRGADGNVLPGDARKELSVEKGDVVYVTGTAQYNAAVNTVMVDATGVFRKPKS